MKCKFLIQVTDTNEVRIQMVSLDSSSELQLLQKMVGGYIEFVNPAKSKYAFFCKDDGAIDGKSSRNYIGSLMYGTDVYGDIAIIKGYADGGETIYFDFDEATKVAEKVAKAIKRKFNKPLKYHIKIRKEEK